MQACEGLMSATKGMLESGWLSVSTTKRVGLIHRIRMAGLSGWQICQLRILSGHDFI